DQARRSESEALEDFLGPDVVDDEDQAAAMVVVGPAVEPLRREHRVLRRLDDGRASRAVGELDDALDPQQIIAAVARQPAERAREIEAADLALQSDSEYRDAVAVRMCAAKPPPVLGCASDSLPR